MIQNTVEMILAFILVLAPLVFIHEFGHFIVAKLFGIGVPVFSLGFGPRILGFRRAETDYRLSLVPLGGYVRLAGDEADENRTGSPDEFLSRPKYQRFFVFVAGATFNVILAFLAFWLLYGVFGKEVLPDAYPTIRQVAVGSPAAAAGLLPGDEIIEISGQDVKSEAFLKIYSLEVTLSPNSDRELLIRRDGQNRTVVMNTGADPKLGHGVPGFKLSLGSGITPVIAMVVRGGAAEEAGFESGDVVVAAGGQDDIKQLAFRMLIEAHADSPIDVTVDRNGAKISLTVTPELIQDTGRIGVSFKAAERKHFTVASAARESFETNLSMSKTLFIILQRLVTGNVPLKTMSGPIGIAQVARDAFIAGPETFLYLLGFFSLQLGILNLLPIPVLDGGHILILGVESIMRRDLSEKLKERVMQVGFVFLLTFMGVIIYLDIVKF